MAYSVRTDSEVTVAQLGHEVADLSLGQVERGPEGGMPAAMEEYRSKECAELRNLEETYILNTNLTSRGKKLLKLLISKTRLIKIFEVYRDKTISL